MQFLDVLVIDGFFINFARYTWMLPCLLIVANCNALLYKTNPLIANLFAKTNLCHLLFLMRFLVCNAVSKFFTDLSVEKNCIPNPFGRNYFSGRYYVQRMLNYYMICCDTQINFADKLWNSTINFYAKNTTMRARVWLSFLFLKICKRISIDLYCRTDFISF